MSLVGGNCSVEEENMVSLVAFDVHTVSECMVSQQEDNIALSVFGIRCSVFGVRHSTFGVRRPIDSIHFGLPRTKQACTPRRQSVHHVRVEVAEFARD